MCYVDVPFMAGAKADVKLSPRNHTDNTVENITRRFTMELKNRALLVLALMCLPQSGPQVSEKMSWIADTCASTDGH